MAKKADLQKSLDVAVNVGEGLTPKKKPTGIGNIAAALNPSAHKKADNNLVIMDTFDYDTAFHMAFIGAGQGGSRIAASFWNLGYRRVGLFNTTEQDWAEPSDEDKHNPLRIDPEIPRLSLCIGGAFKDMQFARQALEGRDEEIWDLYQRSWGTTLDCALVCVGLGGGTGSGTCLPLIKMARKYMESQQRIPRVGAIVSLPGSDDGQQVCRNAVQAFKELLQDKVSPIIIIDNAKVHELFARKMRDLLPKSNQLVSQLFHLFNQLAAAKSQFITFDRSEFAQLLDNGIVVMGSADIPLSTINTPADISTAIREQLAVSVLADVDLRRGKKAACIFVASDEALDYSKDYFSAGFNQLNRIVGSGHPEGTSIVVHRGLYRGIADGLQCYTMISELEPPTHKLQALAKVAGLALGTESSIARYLGLE